MAMSPNPNWTRWIHASLNTYFSDYLKPYSIAYQIIGQEQDVTGQKAWIILRWDGPHMKEISAGVWHLDVELSIVISSLTTLDDTHLHKKIVGIVQASLAPEILIFKFGDETDIDTQDLLGCLQLRMDDREAIVTNYLGKVDIDVTLEQTNVEARYRMLLIFY